MRHVRRSVSSSGGVRTAILGPGLAVAPCQELIVDVAEQEAEALPEATQSAGWRKWLGGKTEPGREA